MKLQLKQIAAVVRKDMLLLWPLAACAMLLLTGYNAIQGEDLARLPELVRFLLPVSAYISSGLLIASAIYADAPAGIRHEWLTRPVSRPVLLAAKAAFVLTVVLVPVVIGETIAGIRRGAPWEEIILAATSIGWSPVASVLLICVIAAMTSTLIEGIVIAALTLGLSQLLVPVVLNFSGTGEELYISGAFWIAERPRVLFAFAVGAVLMWMMYAHRRTRAARTIFTAAVLLLVISPLFTPWRTVFAAQKRLAPSPSASDPIRIERNGACLRAITVNPPSAVSSSGDDEPAWSSNALSDVLSSRRWSEDQRRTAGARAIGFETAVTLSGAPLGWRTIVARVDAAYVHSDNRILHELRPARFTPTLRRVDTGTQLVSHYWLLPRTTGEALATVDADLSVDYSLTLLRPVSSTVIPADGQRRRIEGFGFCDAQFDRATSTIAVDCFKRGAQPGQMTANLVGGSADLEVASDYPDYTPSAFEVLGGRRHIMVLRNVPKEDAERVTLTNYEPQAHFNRTVTSEGVLGADEDACPLPDNDELEEAP